jgi:hypothetical protein
MSSSKNVDSFCWEWPDPDSALCEAEIGRRTTEQATVEQTNADWLNREPAKLDAETPPRSRGASLEEIERALATLDFVTPPEPRDGIDEFERFAATLEAESAPGQHDKIGTGEPCDKIGKSRRRKSITADGSFIDDLRALEYFGFRRRRGALVGIDPLSLPLSYSHSHTYRKPKPWRDTSDNVRGLFYHQAVKAIASERGLLHRGFTLRLSNDVERVARCRGKGCLESLHRRVRQHLRRALRASYDVSGTVWWFAIEEAHDSALHLHGEIAFQSADLPVVRRALRGAGGEWFIIRKDGVRQRAPHQLKWARNPNGSLVPDAGWAGYCLKDVHKASPSRRRYWAKQPYAPPRHFVATFDGKAVTASQAVNEAARDIHGDAVKTVIEYRSRRAA